MNAPVPVLNRAITQADIYAFLDIGVSTASDWPCSTLPAIAKGLQKLVQSGDGYSLFSDQRNSEVGA
jgi:hypothetical protein